MIQIYKEQKENIEARLIGIKNGAPKVIKNAINKAVDSAKNDMVNKVKETYTIKSKNAITKTIKISKANIKNLTATITSRGVAVPLIDFNVKPSKPLKGKNRPYLYVQVKKGEGGIIKRAFITKGKTTGKIGIYERVGNARYPISQKYGHQSLRWLGQEM